MTAKQKEHIASFLRRRHRAELEEFNSALVRSLTRANQSVYVLPLHGRRSTLGNVDEAIAFIGRYRESEPGAPFTRYEVGVRYSNGDEIRGPFTDKATAIGFLRGAQ